MPTNFLTSVDDLPEDDWALDDDLDWAADEGDDELSDEDIARYQAMLVEDFGENYGEVLAKAARDRDDQHFPVDRGLNKLLAAVKGVEESRDEPHLLVVDVGPVPSQIDQDQPRTELRGWRWQVSNAGVVAWLGTDLWFDLEDQADSQVVLEDLLDHLREEAAQSTAAGVLALILAADRIVGADEPHLSARTGQSRPPPFAVNTAGGDTSAYIPRI